VWKGDWIPVELRRVLAETPELGRAYLAGGCVRDWLLGRAGHDYDVEVYGIGYERLVEALSRWGRVDRVGRSFGVVKLTVSGRTTYDFTVPRRDSKVGLGHKGFEVAFDPELTPAQAALRRDFTINSLLYDPRRGELLDFVGGQADLRGRILRHTSEAFLEDPLRVLRGMQFAARFGLGAAPETLALCRRIRGSHGELARERIWDEWLKWAVRAEVPSAGLRFLRDTGWLAHYPELEALVGTPQDPEWHPEGDVFVHTGHCCDALAGLAEWQGLDATSRAVYMFAVLAHDLGKPATTQSDLVEFLVDDHFVAAAEGFGMVAGDGEFDLFELDGSDLFIDETEGDGDAVEDGLGAGRAAGDVEIDGEDFSTGPRTL
jgi:tRNA nucleotidyltransferase (CCA-adding enzyme)